MKLGSLLNFIAVIIVVFACSDLLKRKSTRPQQRGASEEARPPATMGATSNHHRGDAMDIEPPGPEATVKQAVEDKMDIDPPAKTLLIGVRGLPWGSVKDHLEKGKEKSFIRTLIRDGVYAEEGIMPFFPAIPVPNLHAMVTGAYPGKHGVVADEFYDPDEEKYYGVDPFTYSFVKKAWENFIDVNDPEEVRSAKEGQKIFGGEPIWETMGKGTVACMYWPGCEFGGFDDKNFVKFNPGADTLPWKDRVQQVRTWLDDDAIQLVLMDYRDLIEDAREHGLKNLPQQVATLDDRIRDFADELSLGTEAGNRKFDLNLVIVGSNGLSALKNNKPVLPNFDSLPHDLFHVWSREPSMWLVQPTERKMGEMSEPMAKWVSQSTKTGYTIYEMLQIPEEWHYSGSDRIPDIVVVADEGVILSHKRKGKSYGDGYNINEPSMQPAFIAFGSAFKKGKTVDKENMSTGDVHFLLHRLLNKPLPAEQSSFSWYKHAEYIDEFLLRQHPDSPSDTEIRDAMDTDTNVE